MAATSAPAVKLALLAAFQASTTFTAAGVDVTYGAPSGTAITQEMIYFGITRERETSAAMGQQRRDERYSVEVIVDVILDGDDPQACEATCLAYVQEIENILRTRAAMATVAGFSGWCVFGRYEVTPYILEGQRLSEAVIEVEVVNRK